MRITTFVLSAALVAFSMTTTLLAQKSFEGIITMQGSGENEIAGTFSVKGDLVLVEMANTGGPSKMLSNRKTKNMTVFVEKDGQKIAMKMGPEMLQGMGNLNAGQSNTPASKAEVTFTGNTKKIGKYTCKEVIAKEDGNEVTAWVTEDLGITIFDLFPIMEDALQTQGAGGDKAMFEVLRKGMVLEATMKRGGSDIPEKLVTKVEEKQLPEALFTVSEEEYKVYDMTNMVQMMMEMQSDPEKMKEFQELMNSLNQN